MGTVTLRAPAGHWRTLALSLVALVVASCGATTTSPSTGAGAPTGAGPGASGTGSTAPTIEDKQLKIVGAEPNYTLDPTAAATGASWRIIEFLADPLFDRDANFEKIPWLAEDWATEDDGKTWVFTLRDGLKFSDGSPLTADDVKFTLDLYKPTDLWKGFMTSYESAEVVDPRTVRILLSEPRADFWEIPLTQSQYVILSKAAYEAGGDASLDKMAATSGPYRIKEYVPKSHIVFERNPNYWRLSVDGFPKYSEIRWDFVEDQAAMVAAVESGSADLMSPVPAADVTRLRANSSVAIHQAQVPNLIGWGFDKTKPPFSDQRVRQAVGLATDPDERSEVCWFGTGSPLYGGVFYSFQPFYKEGNAEPWKAPREERLTAAKALLDEAGWVEAADGTRESRGIDGLPDGTKFTFEVVYESNWTAAGCHTQLYQEWLKDVGIDARPRAYDPASYYADVKADKFSVFHTGWFSYLSAREIFRNVFHSEGFGNDFTVRHKSPDLDAKIEAAERESDPNRQAELYLELEREVSDLALITITGSQDVVAMTTANVTGFYARMDYSNRALLVSDKK